MTVSNIVRRTTTGDITTASGYLRAVILTPGSDAASAAVKAGGSSGTTILTLTALANGVSVPSGELFDALCKDGIHVTLTGTGPAVTVVFA